MRHAMRVSFLVMAVVATTGGGAFGEGAVPATMPAAVEKAEMPVRRVVLFSSGVGFFEHGMMVDGNVATPLKFETSQINDVLKSLVVFDRDGGAVRNITYPANDPVNKTLRSFQVDLSGNPPLADIINQMRGTAVEITLGDEMVKGTILGVESKDKTVGKGDAEKVVTTWMVNVITEKGIRAVSLDDVRNVDVKDEKIKKEMAAALASLAQARDQTKKVVTVNFEGVGKRRAGLGYLVETPIWKASYRLMLPEVTSKDIAKLQGWAIVENQTDNDWVDVDLSLVGGRPLGFIELLYQPLYNPRPVERPAIAANMHPQTYDDGMKGGGGDAAGIQPQMYDLQAITKGGTTTGGAGGGGTTGLFTDTGAEKKPQQQNFVSNFDDTPRDYSQGVGSIAQTAKIGEMFHFNVDKVSLPRQQSSMIPIIADEVTVDRVSIYNAAVLEQRALRGVRLKNKTGKYLLGGPVTVLDTVKEGTSYAGDAKIDDIPAGQSRLLSYAVDQDMLVNVSTDGSENGLVGGKIAKGLLTLRSINRDVTEYAVDNKGDLEKSVIIEHPILAGFELKGPVKVEEKTDTEYRFALSVPAKAANKLRVVTEMVNYQEVAILKMGDGDIISYVQTGKLPAKVNEMLQAVVAKRAAVAVIDKKIRVKTEDRTRILEELGNIRENIRVLPAGSKGQQDAIADLAAHDIDLKGANKEVRELQAAEAAALGELEKYIMEATAE